MAFSTYQILWKLISKKIFLELKLGNLCDVFFILVVLSDFLVFSEGKKREQWPKMGYKQLIFYFIVMHCGDMASPFTPQPFNSFMTVADII